MLAAWDRSGLGLGAFARREGLDPQRLTRWRRQLASSPVATAFEEVLPVRREAALVLREETAARAEGRFEIVLGSGRVVRVPASFDASALRLLLGVVDEVRAC